MPNGDEHKLTVGTIHTANTTMPSTYYWPQDWQYGVAVKDDYANELEVSEGEHDATLGFYRAKGTGRSLVKEITVPLSVLKALKAKGK